MKTSGSYCLLITFTVVASWGSISLAEGENQRLESSSLSPKEQEQLLLDIRQCGDLDRDWAVAQKYQGRPIVSILIPLISDDSRPDDTRLRAMGLLAATRDPKAVKVFQDIIDRPLGKELTYSQREFLWSAVLLLGRVADDAALDNLITMSKDEYWQAENRNHSVIASAGKLTIEADQFRQQMTILALNAIAQSGTQRAIDFFSARVEKTHQQTDHTLLECAIGMNKLRSIRQAGAPQEHDNGLDLSK